MRQTIFTKDLPNKKMLITREFSGALEDVWQAWTDHRILDQWWAPKPWKAVTKSMDFREGGEWLYSMQGPEGEAHFAKANYIKIVPNKMVELKDAFCDSEGKETHEFPNMHWKMMFKSVEGGTRVEIEVLYDSVADLEKIAELGFQEGFTAAHENLEQYFKAKFELRANNKQGQNVRTATYLNFPGTTEEAFLFYKGVFKSEFRGKGIQRFGDLPADAGSAPVDARIKKMVLHVELPITGGHMLMATDAPREMGFTVTAGNNMHISLEPESRSETTRLFDALSAGGTVTMPMADVFFGAYYGMCTDKFGINWMFNFREH